MIFETVTYADVNQFQISGNQLSYFHVTEIVRALCSGVSVYSSISSATYDGSDTTITTTQNILSDPITEVEIVGIWSGSNGNLPIHSHDDDLTGGSGVKGVNASIFAAAGAPGAGVGVVGDFYFNTSNGDYYKKTEAGWGTALANLTGPQGIQGIQGIQGETGYSAVWLNGSGVPGAGLGNNGDMYLDDSTGDVYGPKTGGAWGSAIYNAEGPQGIQGIQGIQGDPGQDFALVGIWEIS